MTILVSEEEAAAWGYPPPPTPKPRPKPEPGVNPAPKDSDFQPSWAAPHRERGRVNRVIKSVIALARDRNLERLMWAHQRAEEEVKRAQAEAKRTPLSSYALAKLLRKRVPLLGEDFVAEYVAHAHGSLLTKSGGVLLPDEVKPWHRQWPKREEEEEE